MSRLVISLVQCNIVITTNFLSLRKLSFKVWKRLWNHGVTTKVQLNNSNFKANCGITTHLGRKILSFISKASNKSGFFFPDFWRYDNIALNQLFYVQYYLKLGINYFFCKSRTYYSNSHYNYVDLKGFVQ